MRQPSVAADRGSEGARERVGSQLGGVELARRETAELRGDCPRADARRGEHRGAAHELHGCAPRGVRGSAPVGLEARAADTVALDGDREGDLVAAGAPAGGDRHRSWRDVAGALGRDEVVLERERVHHSRKGYAPW
jgi:hypothetical protein